MTRIGLLSDTHGWLDPRLRVLFADRDEIWHAGDLGGLAVADELQAWFPGRKLRVVWGNIDDHHVRRTWPEHQRFAVENVNVWMTHIGGRPPRYDQRVADELRTAPPTLFICGHSHLCMVKFDDKLRFLYMNPGACGRHGFHLVRTVLRFTIDGPELKDLEVVELGRR